MTNVTPGAPVVAAESKASPPASAPPPVAKADSPAPKAAETKEYMFPHGQHHKEDCDIGCELCLKHAEEAAKQNDAAILFKQYTALRIKALADRANTTIGIAVLIAAVVCGVWFHQSTQFAHANCLQENARLFVEYGNLNATHDIAKRDHSDAMMRQWAELHKMCTNIIKKTNHGGHDLLTGEERCISQGSLECAKHRLRAHVCENDSCVESVTYFPDRFDVFAIHSGAADAAQRGLTQVVETVKRIQNEREAHRWVQFQWRH